MDRYSTNLSIRVRWTDPTNLTIGRIFTACLSLTNTLRLIHQSYHSCPMDRFNESFHSCPMDGSDESNHLCPIDRTRPVPISFPHYCGTEFTNRTDGVDSTVLDNPLHHQLLGSMSLKLQVTNYESVNFTRGERIN